MGFQCLGFAFDIAAFKVVVFSVVAMTTRRADWRFATRQHTGENDVCL